MLGVDSWSSVGVGDQSLLHSRQVGVDVDDVQFVFLHAVLQGCLFHIIGLQFEIDGRIWTN